MPHSLFLKVKHHYLVILINKKLKTKMKKIRHRRSPFRLAYKTIREMDNKRMRKKINFLYFKIVWAVQQLLFSIKIILFSVILVNKIFSILVKNKKKMMRVKKMMMMMESRAVKVLPHFKMIMKIKIT
jgi:hypothetical protein